MAPRRLEGAVSARVMHKSPDPFAGCVGYPYGMTTIYCKVLSEKEIVPVFREWITRVPRPLLIFSRPLNQQIYPQAWSSVNFLHQQGLRLFS
jgi:hypothetical protein